MAIIKCNLNVLEKEEDIFGLAILRYTSARSILGEFVVILNTVKGNVEEIARYVYKKYLEPQKINPYNIRWVEYDRPNEALDMPIKEIIFSKSFKIYVRLELNQIFSKNIMEAFKMAMINRKNAIDIYKFNGFKVYIFNDLSIGYQKDS